MYQHQYIIPNICRYRFIGQYGIYPWFHATISVQGIWIVPEKILTIQAKCLSTLAQWNISFTVPLFHAAIMDKVHGSFQMRLMLIRIGKRLILDLEKVLQILHRSWYKCWTWFVHIHSIYKSYTLRLVFLLHRIKLLKRKQNFLVIM